MIFFPFLIIKVVKIFFVNVCCGQIMFAIPSWQQEQLQVTLSMMQVRVPYNAFYIVKLNGQRLKIFSFKNRCY